nr:hypothetical protein C08F1.7 - Caenorhabditis elegans [Caenorhabditis elegans]
MSTSNQSYPYEGAMLIAKRISQLGFCTTSFFGTLLILITVFFSNKNVGRYKYLVIMFLSLGIFFTIVEATLCPNVHSYTGSWLLYSIEQPFGLSVYYMKIFLVFYTGVYASTICMLSVQFVYRYCAIFYQDGLKIFEGWRILLVLTYCAGFGMIWGGSIYMFSPVDDFAKDFLRHEMSMQYGIDIDNVPAFTLVAYDKDGHFRWFNSTANFIQFSIIIFCAAVMCLKMEENMKMMSESLRSVHRQFFRTLIIQIVAPTIFLFTPLTFILYHPFLNQAISFPTGTFLCAISFFPTVDAIVIMVVVNKYRNAVKKIFCFACRRSNAYGRKPSKIQTTITQTYSTQH